MTDLWDSVLKTAEQQRAKGMAKYGKPVTADETVDWLQHAVEEHLDAAVYLEAAKSVLLKLTEANSQLSKECEEWLNLYSDEHKAVAELKSRLSVLTEQKGQLEADLELKKDIAERRFQREVVADNTIAELNKAFKTLQTQKETEEAEWASVAKRLRTELENSEILCNLLRKRLITAGNRHWLSWLACIAVGAAIAALFAL